MEDEIENGGGITLGYILRTIFSQKWLTLIIAAVITVAGTLGLYFWGKHDEVYSVSFVLQLPNTGDATSTSYTYPDGESFYFTDLISLENLKDVAERDEFKDIDVEKIIKSNDISIARTVDRVDENSTEGVYDLNYTIKVKAKYFPDEDTARSFIEALASFPREYVAKMNINYDQSLTTSKSATTYEEQLTLLKSQAVYIQSKYAELIRAYGSEFVVKDGRTLAQCKDEIDAYISKDLFNALKEVAKENGYVKSGSSEEKLKYESEKLSKERALERAENTLKELVGFQTSTGSTIIYDEIISLNREIATLKQEIKILEKYIASFTAEKTSPEEFTGEIAKVEASVNKFTEDIKPVASDVYGRVTKINYLNSKIVEVEGGKGLVMCAALSLVAGIILAAVVAYIVGWSKQKKAGAEIVARGVPVYSEAQLQIAAADETEENAEDDKKE